MSEKTSIKLSIDEYFKYHPVMTPKRKIAHDEINEAAKQFALTVEKNVKDEKCYDSAVQMIQQARMFANQGATIDELVELKKNSQQVAENDFLVRVHEEKQELDSKIQKLTIFIQSDEYSKLEELNKKLLSMQLDVMIEYFDILEERIDLY